VRGRCRLEIILKPENIQFSIDTETLGLKDDAPIIQIGVAAFDIFAEPGTVIDSMEFAVDHGIINNVEPYAAAMNYKILALLGGYEVEDPLTCGVVPVSRASAVIGSWMGTFGVETPTCCGKNFSSFDRPKLEQLPDWHARVARIHHRSPDPGSMWWVPKEDGATLPGLKTCMERAGIGGEVAHTAEEDAIVVAKLIQLWVQKQENMREYCENIR